jgi:3-hydroxyisobutyrate dehydrogenase
MNARIGFAGLGTMGVPMAHSLLRAGVPLRVWNRHAAKCAPLVAAGAVAAASVDALFAQTQTILLMLADEAAIDAVLARGTSTFAARVKGRTLVNMGTVATDYSQTLCGEIRAAGGAYVEAPVSGSRKPAEAGQLVGLVAGRDAEVARVRSLMAPMCSKTVACGDVPNALLMKHATNMLLIPIMAGLSHAARFAKLAGLDLAVFSDVPLSGQMASDLLRAKLPKLVAADFAPQAAVRNVRTSADAAILAAGLCGFDPPILETCRALLVAAEAQGRGEDDAMALVETDFDLGAAATRRN